ncbi:uncharacterized protein LOC123988949 [Osmia bicornis bicornis]|uniref:uncharacterized protein LOC123988949 n=1 Tax=Osmia bicornis bicornis TaxID=1437191 RepID=UPI001EAEBF1F|nr:uncharacterized protein LOC123988949 [Osmia bicornis bicornis]
MGTTSSATAQEEAHTFHCRTEANIGPLLQRFWELEEVHDRPPMSEEEEKCERHFKGTHARNKNGRYVVRLPFVREPAASLKPSRTSALKLLFNCERRLASNHALKDKYGKFLEEYLSLQHMKAVPETAKEESAYYLPHHAVVKRHDPTAKLRVVFNASFRTASGYSLNDCLSAGPKLQADLWMVLTRWRIFKVVFTTDVVKMFRQIQVHPEDTKWQRILWRTGPDERVQDFQLITVTYGTACAPFLALRVLNQLAEDEGDRLPLGAAAIRRHTYVDDILAGADDVDEALQVKGQVIQIFQAGGFNLSKWASNVPELRENGASDQHLFQEWPGIATLGVNWDPTTDSFSLRVAPQADSPPASTKRSILSEVASLFDPFGWVAPVLVTAKILMQDLWILGADWDQTLPEDIQTRWQTFRHSLDQLETITIPRWIFTSSKSQPNLELHGFCDASQRAYAAAVYLRVEHEGQVRTSLVVAKTKVAPVKTATIPRLELCGASLLSKLMVRVKEGLDLPVRMQAWTDSSVCLYWIRGHASQWKPFVAHRVSDIQSELPPDFWKYVASSDNPADLATRGISPADLLRAELWWQGPSWLSKSSNQWPAECLKKSETTDLEQRKVTVHLAVEDNSDELLTRYSSLSRLLTVLAYCFRFSNLARKRPCESGFIKAEERASALRAALRVSQQAYFGEELSHLQGHRELKRSSPLASLRPFLDEQGLLRVGGRLANALLPFDERHPYLVSRNCPLATLLVRDAHLRTLHGGPQLTRSHMVRQFWILRGRSLVRAEIKKCVKCARFSGRAGGQLMGHLPNTRTAPQRAFLTTGVDYAGPVKIRTTAGRGHKSYKGYVALFVCLSTRALHLEAVSDLTSSAFFAAFKRFTSRRGRCATMLSDNGTTFQGADRELRSLFQQASNFYQEAASLLAKDGTSWRFIPPYAPHFWGLWEAGVKSVKHHLRRIMGDSTLTYEELSTLLCQIEACVNSRPLFALSDDPSELGALTPGHFLIGETPSSVPEPEASSTTHNTSLSGRWRQLNLMRAQFWHLWRREYLQHLHRLPKWRRHRPNLEVGNLVLIRDELMPPAKWPLGRVEALHPGKDGQVRVVTIRTKGGTVLRPIVKICPLPVPPSDAT